MGYGRKIVDSRYRRYHLKIFFLSLVLRYWQDRPSWGTLNLVHFKFKFKFNSSPLRFIGLVRLTLVIVATSQAWNKWTIGGCSLGVVLQIDRWSTSLCSCLSGSMNTVGRFFCGTRPAFECQILSNTGWVAVGCTYLWMPIRACPFNVLDVSLYHPSLLVIQFACDKVLLVNCHDTFQHSCNICWNILTPARVVCLLIMPNPNTCVTRFMCWLFQNSCCRR